jgi:hypothetical protein
MSGHAAPAVAPTQGASSKRGTIAGLVGGLIVLVLLAFMAQCGARAISNQKTVTPTNHNQCDPSGKNTRSCAGK